MISIRRVLCPTDLSSEADEALRYAVALTLAYEARLLLLYCRETSSNDNGNRAINTARLFAESLAPHLGLKELSNLNWEGVVAQNVGDIGNTIVREAATRRVDLIVMRSRRRPHSAALLGSTAETVCRTAPCPVLVTHPREREWVGRSTGEIDLHRVLVAHDFSADSELAIKYGLSLAQEYQAELHLLHVVSKADCNETQVVWSDGVPEGLYGGEALKLRTAIPKEATLWCRVVSAVRCGKAYQEVLTYAEENRIDLICMGASGINFVPGSLFGSNVDRVLRQAPCPILVARPVRPVGFGSVEKHLDRELVSS